MSRTIAGLLTLPDLGSPTLPWVLGRGLGIAALLTLTALTALGLWVRHPWRASFAWPGQAAMLRGHATLAAATLVLLCGHVVALVLDPYAGVSWQQAAVPGSAAYRPVAIGLGTAAVYLGLLVGLTAALAGRLAGRAWLPIHRLAVGCFLLAWAHGVTAGSDTPLLRTGYAVVGGLVLLLALSRRMARPAVLSRGAR
jgi:methionine sulfoxide reductase heme-binding subunit